MANIKTVETKTTHNKMASLRPLISIKADDSGALPSKLEVLQTGWWDAPYHGQFMISPEDLQEYVQNFQADVRPSSSTKGLPIDLDHDQGAAAGWMTALNTLPNDLGGWSLWADVSWTPMGQQKLADGEYAFFSPEFCPEGYIDPEGDDDPCDNVLIGGGLTNRPLFKDLQPIMASDASGKSSGLKSQFNKMFLSAKEGDVPTLDEVRVKDVAALSDEEKQLLADNKDQLSADEQSKFGLSGDGGSDPATPPAPADGGEGGDEPAGDQNTNPNPEGDPVAANDKGQVTISASDLADLKKAAAQGVSANEKLIYKEASDHINSKVFDTQTGFKFAQDMQPELVELYVSADEKQKATLDKLFDAAQPIKSADEMRRNGSSEDAIAGGGAYKALQEKTNEIMKADEKIGFSDAMVQARRENPELAQAYDQDYEAGKPNVQQAK